MLRQLVSLFLAVTALAVIPHPDDAPKPLSPAESAKAFALPAGMKIELLASEPLIHEPSGVCWDERGRMFVCELHGYNVEGQHDIDELNKSGELDLEVRRIQATPQSKNCMPRSGASRPINLSRRRRRPRSGRTPRL